MGSGKISSPPPKASQATAAAQPAAVTPQKSDAPSQPLAETPPPSPKLSESDKQRRNASMKMRATALKESIKMQLPEGERQSSKPPLEKQARSFDLRESIRAKTDPKGASEGLGTVSGQPGFAEAAKTGSIEQKYGPKVARDFQTMNDELKAELPGLQQKRDQKAFMPAEDKEKLKRLESLQKRLDTDPASREYFAKEMAANAKDPLYKHLGPTKFASMLADSDSSIKSGKDGKPIPTYNMSTMERVALYGYTTKDYGAINLAMRKDGGKASDPGLAAYATHATNAMKKLPDLAGDANTSLYRSLFPPPKGAEEWAVKKFEKLNFKPGGKYHDDAFASHSSSRDVLAGGVWKLTVQGTKNFKDVGPYSVWPGEAEVLALPGTKFDVLSVNDKDITLKAR